MKFESQIFSKSKLSVILFFKPDLDLHPLFLNTLLCLDFSALEKKKKAILNFNYTFLKRAFCLLISFPSMSLTIHPFLHPQVGMDEEEALLHSTQVNTMEEE